MKVENKRLHSEPLTQTEANTSTINAKVVASKTEFDGTSSRKAQG
jgi:hypothetical protein